MKQITVLLRIFKFGSRSAFFKRKGSYHQNLLSRIAVLRKILLQCIEALILSTLLLNFDGKDFIGKIGDSEDCCL